MYIAALDKQLTSASSGTDTLTFEYNEDGLRQKKTVNNVDTDYFYNGSVLIGMQQGTDVVCMQDRIGLFTTGHCGSYLKQFDSVRRLHRKAEIRG